MVQATTRRSRGHKPLPVREPLTRDRIIATALAYCDANGVEALTMRNLAAELGVQPMSLYHHVEGKDGILAGMIEAMLAETEIGAASVDWREWVAIVFASMRGLAHKHPGAIEVLYSAPTSGPTAAQASAMGLDAFVRGGFTPLQAAQAVSGVSLAALGLSSNERLIPGAERNDAEQLRLARALHPSLASLTQQELTAADEWAFTQQIVIAGLESLIRSSDNR